MDINGTWNDLAEAISKLPAEERAKQVHINIDDESTFRKVAGLETIQADVYVNKGNVCIGRNPLSRN